MGNLFVVTAILIPVYFCMYYLATWIMCKVGLFPREWIKKQPAGKADE